MSHEIFAVESPVSVISGETLTLSLTWLGATSVSAPGATVYHNGTDETSTIMPSGSHSASGNVQTLKPITAMVGGEDYVIAASATVDGNTEIRKVLIKCVKASAER